MAAAMAGGPNLTHPSETQTLIERVGCDFAPLDGVPPTTEPAQHRLVMIMINVRASAPAAGYPGPARCCRQRGTGHLSEPGHFRGPFVSAPPGWPKTSTRPAPAVWPAPPRSSSTAAANTAPTTS